MKKLFAIILSAMLILTMCTVTAFAIDQSVDLDEAVGRLEITVQGDQPGDLTVNDGHFSTDAMSNVDPEASFTMNGGKFFEPLPESFNMKQFGQPMNGEMPNGQQPQMGDNMPNGQQPQMNGNLPNGQQNASLSGSASEVVSGTMTNSAADLETGVQMPNNDQNDRQQEQPINDSQQNETPQGQNNDQPRAENNSPQQNSPSN